MNECRTSNLHYAELGTLVKKKRRALWTRSHLGHITFHTGFLHDHIRDSHSRGMVAYPDPVRSVTLAKASRSVFLFISLHLSELLFLAPPICPCLVLWQQ